MESATEYQLKLVSWTYFCTFTWSASQLGSVRSRESQIWDFFREWVEYERNETQLPQVNLARTPIVIRWERGETGDRPHAHALIQCTLRGQLTACFYRMHQWNTVHGYGFARIRLYDGVTNFADYCAQGLTAESARNDLSNANSYELGKFDFADRLCINSAAWRVMCKTAGVPYVPQLRNS